MGLNNILVALDNNPSADAALRGAVAMQLAYDAHLTAIVSLQEQQGASSDMFPWVPAAIRKNIEKAASDAHDAVEGKFLTATAELNREKIHLVERVTATDTSVSEASRFFDITVVGIPASGSMSFLHPDRIALLSGRPVLAFPENSGGDRVARKAAIAWDGSRASARALNSAIRFMDTKDEVVILTVGAPPKIKIESSGLDPQTALERQGMPAKWIDIEQGKDGIAQTILDGAAEHGAELLIMGAYEHSKFREDLFGGVTHDVMARSNIPVFLAH